eukprot:scaffold49_cov409-Prasinococcus_capsulatus_cf.AAC.38
MSTATGAVGGAMHAPSPHVIMKGVSMNHCLWKYGQENSWLLFVDSDEVLQPIHVQDDDPANDIVQGLAKYDTDTTCALVFTGPLFTSRPQWDLERAVDTGTLDIELYTMRSSDNDSAMKSIYRRPTHETLTGIHTPHICNGGAGGRMVDGNKTRNTFHVPVEDMRLNHYRNTANGGTKGMGTIRDDSMLRYARLLPHA